LSKDDQACPELVEGVADWILDLGPEGGVRGGEIVAEGTPEQVARNPRSFTGQYLAGLLERVKGESVAAE
jgi:excinuclease ABC subunit A